MVLRPEIASYCDRHDKITQNVLAACKVFLVDCGFPNRRHFLALFQDFASNNRDLINANELFNLRHASLRNVMEMIYGIFKSQFTISKSTLPFPIKTQCCTTFFARSLVLMDFQFNQKPMNLKMKQIMMNRVIKFKGNNDKLLMHGELQMWTYDVNDRVQI
ncbi:hypothetical protein DVH24_019905 [Malus domestica]|uniref:DDE Tnp4 domain-containing protein n=1 Tax=Malus domestica TaxID=3750 RepID=A0A498I4Z6_MALDO|nr:hypothetical protein DVH24_019905 [Malus domestica]